jgi:hypothetical protein
MARDHWVETLRCPRCRNTGLADLSDADEDAWAVHVDSVPSGFKAVQLEHGIGFYCISCDTPVEP